MEKFYKIQVLCGSMGIVIRIISEKVKEVYRAHIWVKPLILPKIVKKVFGLEVYV